MKDLDKLSYISAAQQHASELGEVLYELRGDLPESRLKRLGVELGGLLAELRQVEEPIREQQRRAEARARAGKRGARG